MPFLRRLDGHRCVDRDFNFIVLGKRLCPCSFLFIRSFKAYFLSNVLPLLGVRAVSPNVGVVLFVVSELFYLLTFLALRQNSSFLEGGRIWRSFDYALLSQFWRGFDEHSRCSEIYLRQYSRDKSRLSLSHLGWEDLRIVSPPTPIRERLSLVSLTSSDPQKAAACGKRHASADQWA